MPSCRSSIACSGSALAAATDRRRLLRDRRRLARAQRVSRHARTPRHGGRIGAHRASASRVGVVRARRGAAAASAASHRTPRCRSAIRPPWSAWSIALIAYRAWRCGRGRPRHRRAAARRRRRASRPRFSTGTRHFAVGAPGLGTRVPHRDGDHRVRVADDRHGAAPCCRSCVDRRLRSRRPLGWLQDPDAARIARVRLLPEHPRGLRVLTLALVSGAFFVENLFAQHLVHKVVLRAPRVVRVRRAAARALALRLARPQGAALDAVAATRCSGCRISAASWCSKPCSASTGAERRLLDLYRSHTHGLILVCC